jgi:hypothetical protein
MILRVGAARALLRKTWRTIEAENFMISIECKRAVDSRSKSVFGMRRV